MSRAGVAVVLERRLRRDQRVADGQPGWSRTTASQIWDFDTTLSSGREMGIRPTAIARREEWQQTVHGLAAGACRTYHRLSKQPSERGAIAQA